MIFRVSLSFAFLLFFTTLATAQDRQAPAGRQFAGISDENPAIAVTLNADGTITVLDKRTQQIWSQRLLSKDLVPSVELKRPLKATLRFTPANIDVSAAIELDPAAPEFTLTLSSSGPLPRSLSFPHPFTTDKGSYLIIPMNEGISYPVDDSTIRPMWLIAYGGHGICMPFFGATDGRSAYMAILETPDDALIRIERLNGLLCIAPTWESQKGQFGYTRRIRYVFFTEGGHVAIAKRYRAYAQKAGLLKTLADKRKQNPNVDLLIGAVNVWCWDRNPLPIIKDLQAAGITRILWSNRANPDQIKAMNDLPSVVSSRYDIYQDTMNPANFPNLRGTHPDWTTDAWPKDLMLNSKGDWIRGWEVTGKDGTRYPCGVLCDKQAPAYADKRIPDELKTSPYRCRFIDTTTASPWRECYSPDHPVTRSESRHYKMELLRLVCDKYNLVSGCETGHDAAVPFVHYFEGMLSLGPYRVPDSGRDMQRIWTEVPDNVAKFQLGEKYRLPLWELVYHDCVVAQWYWGDYNNKLPALWDKRDLFNALYATPPMFMFNRDLLAKNKARFVQSYNTTCPIARAAGYSEMTDHRFLTPDRSVQQTTFANGLVVTVNFGSTPYTLKAGPTLAPTSLHTAGLKDNAP